MNTDNESARRARIYWQCRRGMLELDLLLQGFFDVHYDTLTGSQRRAFETLLNYPDSVLFEYLMGYMVTADPLIADVIAKIRGPAAA